MPLKRQPKKVSPSDYIGGGIDKLKRDLDKIGGVAKSLLSSLDQIAKALDGDDPETSGEHSGVYLEIPMLFPVSFCAGRLVVDLRAFDVAQEIESSLGEWEDGELDLELIEAQKDGEQKELVLTPGKVHIEVKS